MTDWAALHHAYGKAADVPELISAAAVSGGEDGSAWDDVWSCLCHQGTVYPASYAAIPLLADVAVRHAPAGYIAALDLAAAIVASTDRPAEGVDVRQQHAQELSLLRDLAERNLALAASDTEFIYGLQALMAFEDGGVWQRELNHLADGECRWSARVAVSSCSSIWMGRSSHWPTSAMPPSRRLLFCRSSPMETRLALAYWHWHKRMAAPRSLPESRTSWAEPCAQVAPRPSRFRPPSADRAGCTRICRRQRALRPSGTAAERRVRVTPRGLSVAPHSVAP